MVSPLSLRVNSRALKGTGGARASVEPAPLIRPDGFEPRSRGGRVNLKDPPLDRETLKQAGDAVRYRWVTGALYVDGLNADDVQQGELGDCFLLSSVISVAHVNPASVQDAIKDNGDGTYTVRFFAKTKDGPLATFITVDGQLAWNSETNEQQYASSRDPKELWVGLVEKAYATWKGSYQALADGGLAEEPLYALTGQDSEWVEKLQAVPAQELWERLRAATEDRRPMVSGTFDKSAKKKSPSRDYEKLGLQDGHAYALLEAFEQGGKRFVRLRDPWGNKEYGKGADGKEDGNFVIPFDEWLRTFEDLYVVQG